MPAGDVLKKIQLISDSGYKEAVLTGVHLGCYGKDFSSGNDSLYSLLKRIDETVTISRVRLSSIEPHELTAEIIDLVASSSIFCNHFHIPLQSGDDKILELMNRPYKASRFRDLVLQIQRDEEDDHETVNRQGVPFPVGDTHAALVGRADRSHDLFAGDACGDECRPDDPPAHLTRG